jgi:catechol 2,3-dioxygenase-like lactoylglutathione lyase family enzyme
MMYALDTIFGITWHMDKCIDFYERILGMTVVSKSPYWTEFVLDNGVRFALHPPGDDGLCTVNGGWICALRVSDLSAVEVSLRTNGVEFGARHQIPGGELITISDPDGRPVQVVQRF